jgi:tetratricopeptide (TPR) repeat protein
MSTCFLGSTSQNRKDLAMRAFPRSYHKNTYSFFGALCGGFIVASLAIAAPALAAGDENGSQTPAAGAGAAMGAAGGGAAGAGAGTAQRLKSQSGLTTCQPGMVWDTKQKKCLARHSGVLSDPDLTEYAFALAKADRYQEAIDVLDLLDNPNTPRALNYRGYATRKLGRNDEGIGYYLKSVALDPNYPQVREYLGEAYIVEGKYDLAKDQLAAIEKLCGSGCPYYEDLADALAQAHAL